MIKIKDIKKKYARIFHDGSPKGSHVYLEIGGQTFRIDTHGTISKKSARWWQAQLAIAISNLIDIEAKQ